MISNWPTIAFSESPTAVLDIPPPDSGNGPAGLHGPQESDFESFGDSGVAYV